MAGAENPVQLATQKFDEAIYGLKDSGIEGISQMAERCVDRIRKRELQVLGNNDVFAIPSVTGFDFLEIPISVRQMYTPAIVIDILKVLAASPEVLKGDLARTVALADQSPTNGYERRLRIVYHEALETQAKYLNETNTPPIDFDPRDADRTELTRKLLGDTRFYSDAGFDDWQKAVRDYRASGQDPNITPTLNQLEGAVGHFLVMRQRFVPLMYPGVMQTVGQKQYTKKWDENKRAEGLAYALMGASVYARIPDN